VGALTTAVAQKARSSLVVAGLALGVAAVVAFLPMGAGDGTTSASGFMTNDSSNSMHSVRNVFSRVAEAATAMPDAAAQQAPAEVAGAALQASSPSSTPTAAPTEVPLGQTTVSSALEGATATPIPTVTPATAVPTRTPTLEPTEVATAAPAPATSSLQEALAASQWPAELWPTVERIVRCESSGNTAAYNPAGYVGLMQVSPSLHGPVPADAVGQLNQGYEVYLKQGWGAWGCY
jgi:hypothetical protein